MWVGGGLVGCGVGGRARAVGVSGWLRLRARAGLLAGSPALVKWPVASSSQDGGKGVRGQEACGKRGWFVGPAGEDRGRGVQRTRAGERDARGEY